MAVLFHCLIFKIKFLGDVCIVMKGIESGRKILKELNKKAIFDAHPTQEVSIKFFDEDVYNPTKLYVSHIPAECTEDDVSRVFCRFGAIRKVFLLKFADGTSKGCGFVEYTSNENAKAAIVNLHHKYKMNNSAYSLVVKFSGQAALQPREIDSNYSCNRSEDTASRGLAASKKKKTPRHPEIEYAQEVPQTTPYASPEQIAAYYQQYYAYISNMHPAMQTMQTPQNMYSMQANIQTPTTNNSASTSEAAGVSGRAFQRGPKPECNLYVGNVPLTYTEEDLGAMFRPFGRVISAVLGADPKTKLSKGYGFVSFEEANSASLAIQQTNGLVIGGKKLKVSVKK